MCILFAEFLIMFGADFMGRLLIQTAGAVMDIVTAFAGI